MKVRQLCSWKVYTVAIAIVLITASALFYHRYFCSDLIKIQSITQVLKYTPKADLVVFDIDQTLIRTISKDYLGNTIDWGNLNYVPAIIKYASNATIQKYGARIIQAVHRAGVNASDKRINKAFGSYIEQMYQDFNIWQYLSPTMIAMPVERQTISVIEQLKAQHKPILLYTAREWEEQAATENDLKHAGIIIDKNAVYSEKLVVQPKQDEQRGFGFEQGILSWIKNKTYNGSRNGGKGPILLEFLDAINVHPKNLVFVDDTKERIENLKPLLKAHGIDATVLWYRAAKKQTRPINQLSQADLHVLNSYLPRDWQYLPVDIQQAANFVIERLEGKAVQNINLAQA